jgi:hypothetical protein
MKQRLTKPQIEITASMMPQTTHIQCMFTTCDITWQALWLYVTISARQKIWILISARTSAVPNYSTESLENSYTKWGLHTKLKITEQVEKYS